ncbi:metalloregulator ArsR/SmtB family transcription factor [Amycolatopsis cynarae]|uniref:Metalloregulator ArsR/SmtB family transcription factor n=1 Tax=Amycolatopsis cynarae TaxID=2995223 RepID=A0ABY7B9Y4_9PSEU|nr:metalloregulator ArsR/SmtB family transcription factor [Amycolatopsis sp. HUAS 11-8]WAL68961.1 metalloregulator ArsR/SmtB family transcription factor [Amycolatopsis sp. HUAS 11-8]
MDDQMSFLPQPNLANIEVSAVLAALADPVRLTIVRELNRVGESTCAALDVPVNASTVSHHLHALREAGVVTTRVAGRTRPSRLRVDDLQKRFPGLLPAILDATPAQDPNS